MPYQDTVLDQVSPVGAGSTEPTGRRTGHRFLAPGSAEFTIVLALSMASSAWSIDALLPALNDIRGSFNLASDSSETAALITMFMLGSGVGLLPAGLLADRFGRRAVLWGGFALFILGTIGAALAPSLGWIMVARFVWGIGAAGPRVAAISMVRDVYSGERMAKQMSFMMAVFILVPMIAPAASSELLKIAPWRSVFWVCGAAGLLVVAWSLRLPETLDRDDRRGLSVGEVLAGTRTVLRSPGTAFYVIALVATFGVFISYLATSEVIVGIYDLDDWFPLFFSGLAGAMGVVMLINGRLVERVGLDRMNLALLVINVVVAIALLISSVVSDGQPPFWLLTTLLVPMLGTLGVLSPNLNSAAMRPLGAIAGLGAAILGMTATVGGSLISEGINAMFDGSTTPLCVAFLVAGVIGLVATRLGAAAQRRPVEAHPNG